MNIQDAKQELIRTIVTYTAKTAWGSYAIPSIRQRPVLLIGPPGIGKTAVMEQAAKACGVGFVSYTMTHHTRQSAIGLPFIEHQTFGEREYAVTEYTMSEIIASVFRCIEESGCQEGLLFLDEINCVSETLAPTILQFLQTKTFGSHRLPEGWVLAAAGNPPEYNKSVREFDIATLDRLKYIPVEADYDAWRSYALEMNIHGAILSYLDTHRDCFYVLKQSYSSQAFATARGWEDLSCLLWQYEAQRFPVTAALIAQYLHSEELAQDFAGFYHLYTVRGRAIPVSAFLSGEDTAEKECMAVLADRPMEEKLNFVHQLLSCLGNHLQNWSAQKERASLYDSLQERLLRFQRQQSALSPSELLPSFVKKEQAVIAVRREHGLSSERELQQMQQVLYEIQLEYSQIQTDCSKEIHQNAVEKEAHSLLAMLERAVHLLASADGAEFVVFLSGIFQNPLAVSFFKQYPSTYCEQYREKLDFVSREQQLLQKIKTL